MKKDQGLFDWKVARGGRRFIRYWTARSEWQKKNNTFPSDGRNNPLNLATEYGETIDVSKSDPKNAYNAVDLICQGKFYLPIYRNENIRQLKRLM